MGKKILDDGMSVVALREKDLKEAALLPPQPRYRNIFQRNRDRIIHSAFFRRLEYKTQVFVNGEGDDYRSRLTHTLEVSQIARTIARVLKLNEDFTEAVALAHDIGHTPYGHAGERSLNKLTQDIGGFSHNLQGLRVVDLLEHRYADFRGLGLIYEVREAFVAHHKDSSQLSANLLAEFPQYRYPLLEVMVTMCADDIAYIAHDIDDGLYSGSLITKSLEDLSLWKRIVEQIGLNVYKKLDKHLKRATVCRELINILTIDLIKNSEANLAKKNLNSSLEARLYSESIVSFSTDIFHEQKEMKQFLRNNFYKIADNLPVAQSATKTIEKVYSYYSKNPDQLPGIYIQLLDKKELVCKSSKSTKRIVADFIASMTDRSIQNICNRIDKCR